MQTQDTDTSQEDILSSFREERLEQRKKKPAILIGVSIGIVVAVSVGWLTFGKYVSVYYGADNGELPVIRADSSADGMKPETPGGMEVPNRDKLVYERLRQSNAELPVERLLPAAEKPVRPSVQPDDEKRQADPIGDLAADIIAQDTMPAAAVIYEEDGTPVEVMFRETEPAAVPAEQKSAERPVEQAVAKPAEKHRCRPSGKKMSIFTRYSWFPRVRTARLKANGNDYLKNLRKLLPTNPILYQRRSWQAVLFTVCVSGGLKSMKRQRLCAIS